MQAAEGKQPQKPGQSKTENHRSMAPTPQTRRRIMALGHCVEKHRAQKQGRELDNSQQGDQPRAHT